ncbi:MAG: hypothetical protein KA818_02795 [Methanoculleus sp.]|nr:hypothetical protein [Methanoculleus sp.]
MEVEHSSIMAAVFSEAGGRDAPGQGERLSGLKETISDLVSAALNVGETLVNPFRGKEASGFGIAVVLFFAGVTPLRLLAVDGGGKEDGLDRA